MPVIAGKVASATLPPKKAISRHLAQEKKQVNKLMREAKHQSRMSGGSWKNAGEIRRINTKSLVQLGATRKEKRRKGPG